MVLLQRSNWEKGNQCEKVSDTIEDNFEALEATNKAQLGQNIKDDNLEVDMKVEMTVGEIDEDDTEVG